MSERGKPPKAEPLPGSLTCPPGTGCIPVFHITHVENLAPILTQGGLASHNGCLRQGLTYRRIGDAALKDTRSAFRVRVSPNGFLGDYVPFYLGPLSPMQYRIHCRTVAGYDGTEHDIVYLVSSVDALRRERFACVHTDGQANATFTKHVQGLDEIGSTVDWGVIRGKYWNNTDAYPDRMRRRLAEVLVRDSCPFTAIEGIAVANVAVARRVKDVLRSFGVKRPVVEKPGWYYGRAPQ